jgi:hypothetical protein
MNTGQNPDYTPLFVYYMSLLPGVPSTHPMQEELIFNDLRKPLGFVGGSDQRW